MDLTCPYCVTDPGYPSDSRSARIIGKGVFKRRSDHRFVPRFRCTGCRRSFSAATTDPFYRSQTRQFNQRVYAALCSTNSQRRTARTLKISRGTVVRKLKIFGPLCEARMDFENLREPLLAHCQFDDLETHEHTKMKPLSVTLAVSSDRCILGLAVSRMPARGLLAEKSRAKYGTIQDERDQGRAFLFGKLQPLLSPKATLRSDQNPHYPPDVKAYFPFATHETSKGRKARNNGQGELKKGGFDPLFALNHTCAMLRANVNRLIRKTWCTTKRPERLYLHLSMYADYQNQWNRKKRPPRFPDQSYRAYGSAYSRERSPRNGTS